MRVFPGLLRSRASSRRAVRRASGLLLAFALAAPPVLAQPNDQRREQARSLATEGFQALQQKDYARAEDRFRRADALVHAPTLVVDHARALVGLGRLVEAHERYELVLREGIAPSAPWQWRKAAADAERELVQLKPRLSWLTLRVTGPAEPIGRLDSKLVPLAALGVRRATDAGTHAVSVTAPGFEPKEEMVSLDEGESAALDIVLDPVQSAPARPAPVPAPAPAPAPVEERAGSNTLAYVVLGVAGASLLTGVVTGALSLSARSELASRCPERTCVPRTRSELERDEDTLDRYRLFGTLSGVSFAVGLAAAGTGGALLLFAPGTSDAGIDGVFIAPGRFGLRARGSF